MRYWRFKPACAVYSFEICCTLRSSFLLLPCECMCVCCEVFCVCVCVCVSIFCDSVHKIFNGAHLKTLWIKHFDITCALVVTYQTVWMLAVCLNAMKLNLKAHGATKKSPSCCAVYRPWLLSTAFLCAEQHSHVFLISSCLPALIAAWSSASCPPSLLHPPSWQWDHARGERQHHLRGRGLSHALREVDAGSWRPDARGWHAHRPQRAGADRCAPIQQLHMCRNVNAGRDRGRGSDHCERLVHQSELKKAEEKKACD